MNQLRGNNFGPVVALPWSHGQIAEVALVI